MQDLLIKHCAPVLAGIKTGNLFSYKTNANIAKLECEKVKDMLSQYGVFIDIINSSEDYSLVYVYRKSKLEYDIKNKIATQILKSYGYTGLNVDDLVNMLKIRVSSSKCFPHEIGPFLGYPPEDVLGFIKNKGCDYKICGYWKVYCDEDKALKKFSMFEHCTNVYIKLFNNGRAFEDMVVAI